MYTVELINYSRRERKNYEINIEINILAYLILELIRKIACDIKIIF